MKRHYGKIVNTDARCIVVFMEIPGRETHALVVQSDTLPQRMAQVLLEAVETPECQREPKLAEYLNRIYFAPGKTVLQALHEGGLLYPVPIENIVMLPVPNRPFPLRLILDEMKALEAREAVEIPQADKFNPHAANLSAENADSRKLVAQNLLINADLLMEEARRKREEAYSYWPEFRPVERPTVAAAPETTEKVVRRRGRRKTAPTE